MKKTNKVLLVRPAHFGFNAQTAVSNAFQNKPSEDALEIKAQAIQEFDNLSKQLQAKGIDVHIVADTPNPIKPDAIFPNNWISFHKDGTVILYPMHTPNRRIERRHDIIEQLKKQYTINKVIDLSPYEDSGIILEGTGSIVFDHQRRIAYACLSPRTNKELLLELCRLIDYQALYFYSYDEEGQEIYHTNVMMCMGAQFAVICLDSITNPEERQKVVHALEASNRAIIDISFAQMNNFAGNMLELATPEGKTITVLSQCAYDSLTENQIAEMTKYTTPTPIPIATIETIGGGSVRCMIAEIFLPHNQK